MRPTAIAILLCLASLVLAGQPAKEKTLEASGTAPIGAYTFPSNFATGRSPGAGKTQVGIEITRDQLTNPATTVELVVELSLDGGVSWPLDCLSPATCLCHDHTQDSLMPANTAWCAFTLQGGTVLNQQGQVEMLSSNECQWHQPTDANTRMRGRLHVCGAAATGTVSSTWR